MKHRLVRYIALGIFLFFCLSMWSGIVRHVAIGGERLGALAGPVEEISKFPAKLRQVYKTIFQPPATYIEIPKKHHERVNKLNYDLYGINSFYNNEGGHWEVDLLNFRNDNVLQRWILEQDDFEEASYLSFANVRPQHTLMLDDSSIVVSMSGANCLGRFDKNSKVLWKNTQLKTHHAINLGHDGAVWACTMEDEPESNVAIKNFDGQEVPFRDNNITKYDVKTGKVLFDKSVSKILFDNDLGHLLFYNLETQWDPIHLNDVQPVLEDGEYWVKGDLFLSLRNISTVLQYRPSTNEVIWYHSFYPLLHQHDVDIQEDGVISVFNNNHVNTAFRIGTNADDYTDKYSLLEEYSEPYSQMLRYDFKTDSFKSVLSDQFTKNQIGTPTEGLLEVTENGDVFVESQNRGIVYVINEDGLQLKKVFPTDIDGRYHMPNWIRIVPIN